MSYKIEVEVFETVVNGTDFADAWAGVEALLGQSFSGAELISEAKVIALSLVQTEAKAAADSINDLFTKNPVRALMLNTEIVDYVNQGKPASPNPARYVISAAIATQRGDTLKDTLEALLAKWLTVQAAIAVIAPEANRLTDEIDVATTLAEIETALVSMDWG